MHECSHFYLQLMYLYCVLLMCIRLSFFSSEQLKLWLPCNSNDSQIVYSSGSAK